jgi:urease subunit alpha
MLHNDALPSVEVDPETYRVVVDGELCTCDPVDRVALGRRYVLK